VFRLGNRRVFEISVQSNKTIHIIPVPARVVHDTHAIEAVMDLVQILRLFVRLVTDSTKMSCLVHHLGLSGSRIRHATSRRVSSGPI